jgi:hypothetical protein
MAVLRLHGGWQSSRPNDCRARTRLRTWLRPTGVVRAEEVIGLIQLLFKRQVLLYFAYS